MNRTLALIAGLAAGVGGLADVARAQHQWLRGGGGSWSDSLAWTGGVPNDPAAVALIQTAGAYDVSLTGNVTLAQLQLTNASARVVLTSHAALSLKSGTSTLAGDVILSTGDLYMSPGTHLAGGGSVRMIPINQPADVQIHSDAAGVWYNDAGHTISGGGQLWGGFVNNGSIVNESAYAVTLRSGAITNNGDIGGPLGGGLTVTIATVTQGAGGRLQGNIGLESSTVIGGAINPISSVVSIIGNSTIQGSVVNGSISVGSNSSLTLSQGITHAHAIALDGLAARPSSLLVAAATTLGGTGSTRMNAVAGQPTTATISSPSHAAWIHGTGHSILGTGQLLYDLTNNGTIRADSPGQVLEFALGSPRNNAVIETANGGQIQFSSETVTQAAGGTITAANGDVVLVSSNLSGGSLNATGPSRVVVRPGTTTLNSITVNGPLGVLDGAVLTSQGFTHTGTITVNSDGGTVGASLQMQLATTIAGTGEVVLNATGGVLTRAQMFSPTAASWVNGTGHTIRGCGQLTNAMTNNGTVVADRAGQSLQAQGGILTNNGVLRATGGGALVLNSTNIQQGGGGTISAVDGDVYCNTAVVGGSMTTSGTGRIIGGFSPTQGCVMSGNIQIPGNSTITQNTSGAVNNATILVNSNGTISPNITKYTLPNNGSLVGTGTILLNAVNSELHRARINCTSTPGVISNSHGHTIAGTGAVFSGWTNHGVVHPSGTLRRIGCEQGVFTQAADGTLVIDVAGATDHGALVGTQAKALGGTLEVHLVNGYVPRACDHWTIVTGTVTGTFASVSFPPVARGSFQLEYSANKVDLVYTASDFNGDGAADFFDYDDYVMAFESGDPGADFDGDGSVDFFDYDTFVIAFEGGC